MLEKNKDSFDARDAIIENFIENDQVYWKNNINHEGWNIIQEHIVLWLDAFIASKPSNNTQYMHIYIYICLSCKMRFWTFKRIEVKNYQC